MRVAELSRPVSPARAEWPLPRSPLFPLGAGLRRAEPSVSGAERVLSGGTVHSGRGISGLLTGGATASRSSAAAAAAWPSEPSTGPRRSRDALGLRLLARRALRSGTHLGARLRRLPPAGGAWVQAPPAAGHGARRARAKQRARLLLQPNSGDRKSVV